MLWEKNDPFTIVMSQRHATMRTDKTGSVMDHSVVLKVRDVQDGRAAGMEEKA